MAGLVVLARWAGGETYIAALAILGLLTVLGFQYNYRQVPRVKCHRDELEIPYFFKSAHIPWEMIAAPPRLRIHPIEEESNAADLLSKKGTESEDHYVGEAAYEALFADAHDFRAEAKDESFADLLIDDTDGITLVFGLGILEDLRSWEWDPRRARLHRIPIRGGVAASPLMVVSIVEHWLTVQYANAKSELQLGTPPEPDLRPVSDPSPGLSQVPSLTAGTR